LHKPQAVTALSRKGLRRISEYFDFRDIPGLGGDLGENVENAFGPMSMAELRRTFYRENKFFGFFEEDDFQKINCLINGVCVKEVEHKLMHYGLNCGKNNLSKHYNASVNFTLMKAERTSSKFYHNFSFFQGLNKERFRNSKSGLTTSPKTLQKESKRRGNITVDTRLGLRSNTTNDFVEIASLVDLFPWQIMAMDILSSKSLIQLMTLPFETIDTSKTICHTLLG
jgi:hypothetical protein